jgi:hypothetical protein
MTEANKSTSNRIRDGPAQTCVSLGGIQLDDMTFLESWTYGRFLHRPPASSRVREVVRVALVLAGHHERGFLHRIAELRRTGLIGSHE